MSRTPRNIPCPCGSGIKSKKCCNGDITKMETSKNGKRKIKEYCLEVSKELNMTFSQSPEDETRILMTDERSMIIVERRGIWNNGNLVFGLYGMVTRVKDELQGQGIGTKIMKVRTEISKKYPFPLFLIPSVVDYEPDIYQNSKKMIENWDTLQKTNEKQLEHIKGQHEQIISNYESVDDTIRPNLLKLKNLRLKKFYEGIGYEVVDSIIDVGILMKYNNKMETY